MFRPAKGLGAIGLLIIGCGGQLDAEKPKKIGIHKPIYQKRLWMKWWSKVIFLNPWALA